MHPERDVVDAAGTYTVFGLLISHEGARMFVFFFSFTSEKKLRCRCQSCLTWELRREQLF